MTHPEMKKAQFYLRGKLNWYIVFPLYVGGLHLSSTFREQITLLLNRQNIATRLLRLLYLAEVDEDSHDKSAGFQPL